MIKRMPCMECNGRGFITKLGEYFMWSEQCPSCGGTGIVKIPMTNADRIRAMSDEELAVFLESSRGCPTDDDCEYGVHATPENCIKHWTTWLQQPAEGDT